MSQDSPEIESMRDGVREDHHYCEPASDSELLTTGRFRPTTSGESLEEDLINKLSRKLISKIFLICTRTPNESERAVMFTREIPLYHYRPFLGPNTTPGVLSSVCKRWRAIGLSTPELWSAFTIPSQRNSFQSDSEYGKDFMTTLRLWLERSEDSPLQFNCFFLDPGMKMGTELLSHMCRWDVACFHAIHGYALFGFLYPFRRDLLNATMLHTLEFHHCIGVSKTDFFQLPKLRRLAVNFLIFDGRGRLNLTHLALSDIMVGHTSTKTFLEYLHQLPSLISIKVSIQHVEEWLNCHIPPVPITHATLEELTIDGHGRTAFRTILTNIHLPVIRRLRIIPRFRLGHTLLPELKNDLDNFIRRHESTFTDLEIMSFDCSSEQFMEMLCMFPKYLTWCHFTLGEMTNEAMQKLVLNPSNPSQNLSPNLSYISLTIRSLLPSNPEPHLEKSPSDAVVAEMILSRWKHNPCTTLELSAVYPGFNLLSDRRISGHVQQNPGLLLVHTRGAS